MSSPFFRNVWRFNALAIAAVSGLALIVGAYAAFQIAREIFRIPYRAQDIARVDIAGQQGGDTSAGHEVLSTGNFSRISGTPVLWAPLTGTQSYDFRASGKEASSTRNYLFYDTGSGASRKLFPGETQIVVEAQELRRPDADTNKRAPEALLVSYIAKDTSGDGILSYGDDITVALTRPDGQGFTILGSVQGRAIGEVVSDDGSSLVLVTDDGKQVSAAHVDLAAFKVTRTDKIAP